MNPADRAIAAAQAALREFRDHVAAYPQVAVQVEDDVFLDWLHALSDEESDALVRYHVLLVEAGLAADTLRAYGIED